MLKLTSYPIIVAAAGFVLPLSAEMSWSSMPAKTSPVISLYSDMLKYLQ